MHVRLTMGEGITDVDKAVASLADVVLPPLKAMKGFVGLNASVDRDSGVIGIIATWDSEADLEASAKTADTLREDFRAALGGRITEVRSFELALADLSPTPPGPGAVVVINQAKMDPASVDDNLEFFKANVLPAAQQSAGYRALRNMVDREKGEYLVGFVFADRASAEAFIDAGAARRQAAADRGVQLSGPQIRDVVFAA
jgi:quinol monooxygenase YgiN